MGAKPLQTLDTNVAIYAYTDLGTKAATAQSVIERSDFISVQLLNEFANAVRRKQGRDWSEIVPALARLRRAVPKILPLDEAAHIAAVRLADRYQLGFYDGLMLSVALSGGARTFYSEDMQHGMTIDEILRVVNPFVPGALDT
ncbi:MAG: PIN domain-containing protein [Sphingomonadaceae bacterium]